MIMANYSGGYYGWGSSDFKTGRHKYVEKSFDVNEIICGFGMPAAAVDPYTNTAVKILQPVKTDSISAEFMEHMEWKKIEIKSWENLTKTPAVFLSDMNEHVAGVEITTIHDLPTYMVQCATSVQQFSGCVYSQGAQITMDVQQNPVVQQQPVQQYQPPVQQYPVAQQVQMQQMQPKQYC